MFSTSFKEISELMGFLTKIRRLILSVVKLPVQIPQNIWFAYKNKNLRQQRKIIYALTPPPRLKNVGDHAQVIAIRAWLEKHFPELPVIEMNKDRGNYFLPALRWLVRSDDLVFLHSGGNLGDRGIWSERKRRQIIGNFPNNQVISLPQTIHFSDTPIGKKEQEETRRIYANHPNLTVIGRDLRSGELATELFSKAKTFCMPDFVLSLPPKDLGEKNNPPKVLLCLRLDDESALTPQQRKHIGESLTYEYSYYDTTIPESINLAKREAILEKTLNIFRAADIVVTDRYHGLIFTVLSQKPCVVLRTVDHKLTSAIDWFKDMPHIAFAQNLDEVPSLVERCLKVEDRKTPDWNSKYFDKIPELI